MLRSIVDVDVGEREERRKFIGYGCALFARIYFVVYKN